MIAFNNVDLLMLVAIFFLLLVLIFTSVAEMGLSRITRPKAAWTRRTRSRSSVSGRMRSCGV